MWPLKGEAASGFLARLITESGSSGLGTGVGDVASVGVTNAEDDVSQTVNMKENRGYQHSHCYRSRLETLDEESAGWREREGGRVQLFRFVCSSAPPAAFTLLYVRVLVFIVPGLHLDVSVPIDPHWARCRSPSRFDIGFINDALDSVSRNRPRPAHIRTFSPATERTYHLELVVRNDQHRLVDHHHRVSKGVFIAPPLQQNRLKPNGERIHSVDPTSTIGGLRAIAPSVVPTTTTVLSTTITFPPPKKRKRTRTRAQERELARIRRLDPADQICALLAIKEDRVRYLQEGPGTVYFTRQRDDHGELIVKWGETSCLSRRQLEYEECGGTGQTQMWFVAFEVQRRLLAERVIRLGLIGQGYGRVRFEEPCSCGTSHCEYHWMRPGGSLEEIETIARECLATIEESTVIR
ncbi:hypothetical protein B0H14DRAFT_2641278 [Mycena olivaceomarginata]|nr:hypothetical protein B0H14DRAFT_2641278 [Mycena olivaceomarginata]